MPMNYEIFKRLVEENFFLPFDTWLGIFGAIGVVLSIFFFFWQRKRALPTFSVAGYEWIGEKHTSREGLNVTFRGTPVSRVSTTIFKFWNAGNLSLKSADFSVHDALRIVMPKGIEVFEVSVLKVFPESLEIPLARTQIGKDDLDRAVPLTFDFLKQGEGFKIQVIHDGEPYNQLKIEGRFSGDGGIKNAESLGIGGPFANYSTFGRIQLAFAMFVAGCTGINAIYMSVYSEFHWYYVIGYFFAPYAFLSPGILFTRAIPKAL